eukprot:CAMPEP_0118869462 /NCGR_PEP_ID=MMETSP1163-20130328/12792_1 /TAXON_ID=124430 /ORGANISM="Phaeomonas parva, Strain CCMP2877" /LENGTH=362 /DNA_ID=CAMNT_0006804359 /DNA_START=8 /DNA_END=1100 /DNA_ORIENTATION=+
MAAARVLRSAALRRLWRGARAVYLTGLGDEEFAESLEVGHRITAAQEKLEKARGKEGEGEGAAPATDEDVAENLGLELEEFLEARERAEEARRRLVEENLGVAIAFVQKSRDKMQHKDPTAYPTKQDLIAEAVTGMHRAAEKYNPKLGVKYSTYATWWVRDKVTLALRRDTRIIQLPVRKSRLLEKVLAALLVLREELKRDPSDDELAERCGISKRQVLNLRAMGVFQVDLSDFQWDNCVDEDEECPMPPLTPEEPESKGSAKAAPSTPGYYAHPILEVVDKMLDDNEKAVVLCMYGLSFIWRGKVQPQSGPRKLRLAQVAQELELPPDVTRKLHRSAMDTLRATGELRGWWEDEDTDVAPS